MQSELINSAVTFHKKGKFAEAERLYLGILAAESNHFDAQHLLGVLRYQQGRHLEALNLLDGALRTKPWDPDALSNYGLVLFSLQRFDDALVSYDKALSVRPIFVNAQFNRGNALFALRRYEGALACYGKALAIKPDFAEALSRRGSTLRQLQRLEEALACFDRVLAVKPEDAAILYSRGNTLKELERFEEALANYDRALALKPNFAEALYQRGNALWELKRYEHALVNYDSALALKPQFLDALYNRGNTLWQLERVDDALKSYDKALAIRPEFSDAAYNRGEILQQMERYDEAITSYDNALAIRPDFAEAWYNRGNAMSRVRRFDEALLSYDHALAVKVNDASALNNRGNVCRELKRPEDALLSYEKALSIKPNFADALNNRGIALRELKVFAESLTSYERALAVKPDFVGALNNRGGVLRDLKRFEDALVSCDSGLAIRANFADGLSNRGNVLRDLRRFGEAEVSYEKALLLQPGHVEALHNRGAILHELKRLNEALLTYDRVLSLVPDHIEALNNRGLILYELMRFDEALMSYERLLGLNGDYADAFSKAAYCAMVLCDWGRRTQFMHELRLRIADGRSIVAPFVVLGYSGEPALQMKCAMNYIKDKVPGPRQRRPGKTWRNEKIRVAYLSADFRSHSTALLTTELFQQHDRSCFTILGVSFANIGDGELRSRLVNSVDEFYEVGERSDEEVAALVNDRRVDIGIDLAGYTRDSRVGVFAHRAAPIQVNYMGLGTMGAEFIDYLIADSIVVPVECEAYYVEKVVYLPDCFMVSDTTRRIAERTPARHAMGLPEHAIVFCCFTNYWKITPCIFDIWMRLLQHSEGSVLWLSPAHETGKRNLHKEARRRGIDPSRLVFADWLPFEEHLARFRLADLFLDTLPYNANTTASEALWVGLPVLTCKGDAFAGRIAASLLRGIGVPELITSNLEEYETLALRLARDPALLVEIKGKLASHRTSHPLFNTARFARHIEAAYLTMWKVWQSGETPKSFSVNAIESDIGAGMGSRWKWTL
jgi:protein O-GlcNAc transferase